ncbi:hypothetical protein [Flavobacterium sp.]|uniref:hypothetical protein n=1 Tax=Flavobacterium sp. TaxID=239 RepID=UPI00391E0532
MKSNKLIYLLISIIVAILLISYFVPINTGRYCSESPVLRWKFAIYRGECNDVSDSCDFTKMENTGVLEYFGLKKIYCNGEDINIDERYIISHDTAANPIDNDFKNTDNRDK